MLRVLRFLAVGAIGFALDFGLFWLSVRSLGASPWAARVMSASIAMLATYLMNSAITFSHSMRSVRQFFLYASCSLLSLSVNVGIFAMLTSILPTDRFWLTSLALVVGVASGLTSNYFLYARVVFDRVPAENSCP